MDVPITVTGAIVTLSDQQGYAFFVGAPNPFTVAVADFVVPGDAPGANVGTIEIVPPGYGLEILEMVRNEGNHPMDLIAAITPYGTTADGSEFEGTEWSWPIRVCTGDCLFRCPTAGETESRACELGQDVVSTVSHLPGGDCPI
jgi:hypothetical protein